MTLDDLVGLFMKAGVSRLYAKTLADNDNSKNQVYFGPHFDILNIFPNEGILPDSSGSNPIFKARLRFGWLQSDGRVAPAPHAQIILYPQYPEVRFSGFLRGCAAPPSSLMTQRLAGRVLFLGVTVDGGIVGFVAAPDSAIAAEYRATASASATGVFNEIDHADILGVLRSRRILINELSRIHHTGWIESKQLDESRNIRPCNAPQCGGFTLEAELNIPKNSRSEPDFLGWEIKQHSVGSFDKYNTGVITLMTPEPTGGFYHSDGPEAFVRRFGYPDRKGRPDRLNFGGIHKVGAVHGLTGLQLRLSGYDVASDRLVRADGQLELVNDSGVVAAAWAFAGLMAHWARKHALCAYVPSMCRTSPRREYFYGHTVRLATGTDYMLFLRALAAGVIFYDPGIKVEHASSKAVVKRRSQFRVKSQNIEFLYRAVEHVGVNSDG